MKQKSFKQSKKFRRNLGSSRGQGGGIKRPLIIGIIVTVAVLLIVAVIAVLVINHSITQMDPDGSLGINQGNIIDNVFGNGNDNSTTEDAIKSVQVVAYPDKRTYYCGEWFDQTGLKVNIFYESGAYETVALEECTITGFDSSAPVEKQTITVTYGEFSDIFTVTIKEVPKPVEVIVESIAIATLPKTEYKVGEWLETAGGTFVVTYTDGTTKMVDMESRHISGFQSAKDNGVGNYTLKVIYVENGIRVQTTYEITITE